MNVSNPAHFRAQFPALADARTISTAATALKPLAVIDASDQSGRLSAGNVHREHAAQRLTGAEAPASAWRRGWNAPPAKISFRRGDHRGHHMVAQSYVRPRLQPWR